MDQATLDICYEFRHTPMERRVFMRRPAEIAGGTAAARKRNRGRS